jgi:hypothetical protein
VTDENRIEYIHLVANYKLNKQINEQVLRFREGMGDVINLEWLRMFDANELRILISGAPGEIDVSDWRNHCQYRGRVSTEMNLTWSYLSSFSSALQQRASTNPGFLAMRSRVHRRTKTKTIKIHHGLFKTTSLRLQGNGRLKR